MQCIDEEPECEEELQLLAAIYTRPGELEIHRREGETPQVRLNVSIGDAKSAWISCSSGTPASGADIGTAWSLDLSGVEPPMDDWASACDQPFTLHCKLPTGYPRVISLQADVDHPAIRASIRDEASAFVSAQARSMVGRPCITELCSLAEIVVLRSIAISLLEARYQAAGNSGSFFDDLAAKASTSTGIGSMPPDEAKRGTVRRAGRRRKRREEREATAAAGAVPEAGLRIIWFHHIRSPTKRRHIQEWAAELGLRGISKIGHPGVVVVDGEEGRCDEYVRRLRALRWKAMALRAEETVKFPGASHCSADGEGPGPRLQDLRWFSAEVGFREVEDTPGEGMGAVASLLRGVGREDLFRTAVLKMPAIGVGVGSGVGRGGGEGARAAASGGEGKDEEKEEETDRGGATDPGVPRISHEHDLDLVGGTTLDEVRESKFESSPVDPPVPVAPG